MTHRKVFRFRLKPNAEHREALARIAGARRFVWNWALAQRQALPRDWQESSRRRTFAPIDGAETRT